MFVARFDGAKPRDALRDRDELLARRTETTDQEAVTVTPGHAGGKSTLDPAHTEEQRDRRWVSRAAATY
jgi:hypothetical protein